MLCSSEEACADVVEVCDGGHRCHRCCILKWCNKKGYENATCPECRRPIDCATLEYQAPIPVYELEFKKGGRKKRRKSVRRTTRTRKYKHKKRHNKRRTYKRTRR